MKEELSSNVYSKNDLSEDNKLIAELDSSRRFYRVIFTSFLSNISMMNKELFIKGMIAKMELKYFGIQ